MRPPNAFLNAKLSIVLAPTSSMDALSHLVTLLDPRGRMDLRCLFGAQFSASHESAGAWRAPFHVVLRGACELWLPESGRTIALRSGSLLMLPRGSAHVLRTGQAGLPIRTLPGEQFDTKTNVGKSRAADIEILCGEFEFRSRRRSLLLDALPEFLVVEFQEREEFGWLQGLLRMMAHEIERQGAGATAIVSELSSAVFTLAVRAHLEASPTQEGVLGLMAQPRLAPALSAMLESPGAPWSVATLAARCNLSRAAFARLFAQHARTTPLDLLTALRMDLASRLLAQGEQDTAAVGEAVGYRSEAAFNRAFTRYASVTPGRFRRGERAPIEPKP